MGAYSFDYYASDGSKMSYRSYYLYLDDGQFLGGFPGDTLDFLCGLYGSKNNFFLQENPFNHSQVNVFEATTGKWLGVWKRCTPEKTHAPDECKKCERRGVFVRTALKCPQCSAILGGF